jgi:hypothetical protein
VGWINLAQDGGQVVGFRETVMKLWFL